MDITSLIGTLLSSDSISGVSKTTKSSSGDVTSILSAALPLLLNGAQAQAEDKSTAASFSKALASHGKEDTSNIASFLDKVDMEDGSIVAPLLGNDGAAVKGIAKKAGTNAKTVTNVLSAAAPLLMSLMGQKDNDDDDDNALGSIAAALIKNVDVGDVVGALLGGGGSKKKANSNGDLLGNILGSLLK